MADIQTLTTLESEAKPASGKKADKKTESAVSSGVPFLNSLGEQWKKTDKTALLVGVVIIGQVFIIYQLVYPAIQITKETHQEYRDAVKQLNDEENKKLKDRVSALEKIILTPTPTPVPTLIRLPTDPTEK